jgi:hypothetical protein
MSRYIDTAEQAVLIRQALKKNFPGTKFSVRIDRYSMGSSVYVKWTDGPTSKNVDAVIGVYDGKRFDGMTDLSYSAEHYLMPDGTAQFRRTYGHSFPQEDGPTPQPEGSEIVHFSGSVSSSRTLSPEFEADIVREIAKAAMKDWQSLYSNGHVSGTIQVPVFVSRETGEILPIMNSVEYVTNLVWQAASYRSGAS